MEPEQLDLKKLKAFELVATLGSLRLAAAKLNQTIPAVSARVRTLERDLSTVLFERDANKMIFRRRGKPYLRDVGSIFERARKTIEKPCCKESQRTHLSVSTGTDISWFVARPLSEFLLANPGVQLTLRTYKTAEAVSGLERGEIDVAVGLFSELPDTLKKRNLAESSLCLVCRAGHPLLHAQTIDPQQLTKYQS